MKYVLESESKSHHKFFEEISSVPRVSFNEKAISEYLIQFAKDRNLWWYTDELWNVIIKKPASKGYENSEPVMIQAHTDIVGEKEPGSDFNFDTDPLQLYVEDGCVRAKGTTLGADDGYGVAYMLAILDSDDIKHPPIECVFSVQEESGIGGPRGLDYSQLSAKRLINLDGIKEGSTNIATANVIGGDWIKNLSMTKNNKPCFSIKISGLNAGHASLNIVKDQANAIKIAARILFALKKEMKINLVSIEGGTIRNGIPEECEAIFACDNTYKDTIAEIVSSVTNDVKVEHAISDPKLNISVAAVESAPSAMNDLSSKSVIELIHTLPSGTHMRVREVDNLPMASRNMGNVNSKNGVLTIGYMFRGAYKTQIADLFDQSSVIADKFGAAYVEEYRYSGYNAPLDSPMLNVWKDVYKEATGEELFLKRSHGGTDVGTIIEGMKGLDVIVLSPKLVDVHRPTESMNLASFDRTFEYLKTILARL